MDVFISQTGQLVVEIDLSGLRSGDLEITHDAGKLIIKGQRQRTDVANAQTVLVNEIAAGPIESVLNLPSGFDVSRAASAYLNGLLRISVPPVDGPSPRLQFLP